MKNTMKMVLALGVLAFAASPVMANDMAADVDAAKLFSKKCKMCHALDKDKTGPAVNGMNADVAVLTSAITNGRNKMPAFGKKFSSEEIDALVIYLQAQHN